MTRSYPATAALLLSCALAAGCALTSCTPAPPMSHDPAPASGGDSDTSQIPPSSADGDHRIPVILGKTTVIATSLAAPWSVAFLSGTALVSERDSARILELAADGTASPIGTVEGVVAAGEGGLLGIALDGQGRLYAYSTAKEGNRIQRFAVTGKPGSLALGGAETILTGLPSAVNHNGGRLAFGPDRMLYATVGDASNRGSAQDLGSLGGKILRMTPDGGVPGDNPFANSLVYSYGHRNPQGLAWAADGTMFASEFGQNTWDELNVITAGSNYGWPTVEGVAGTAGFTDPVQQWSPGVASPSGITIANGTIYMANLRGQVLRGIPLAEPDTSEEYFSGEYGRLRDVAAAPDGSLWFLTNNTDGRGTPEEWDDRIISVALS